MGWRAKLGSPRFIRKLNFIATLFWVILIIPTLTLWSTSVLWVGILSIWANIISHYTAWVAARVEVRAQDLQDKDRERLAHMVAVTDRIERQGIMTVLWLKDIVEGTLTKDQNPPV